METHKKQYSFVNAKKLADGKAFVVAVGFIANELEVKDGKAKFSIPLKNTNRNLTSAFGINEAADETTWLNVTGFDNDKVKLAERCGKILGKRMKVAVAGIVTRNESNGKVYYNMVLRDFSILWSKEFGNTPGGKYSFAQSVKSNTEGMAFAAIEGFIATEPKQEIIGGKNALKFSLALNKTGSNLTYPFGLPKADETLWISVTLFDQDNFKWVDNAAKVLRKGVPIVGAGTLRVTEAENGNKYFNLTMDGFDVLGRNKKDESGSGEYKAKEQEPGVDASVTGQYENQFAGSNSEPEYDPFGQDSQIDISDDDLPF